MGLFKHGNDLFLHRFTPNKSRSLPLYVSLFTEITSRFKYFMAHLLVLIMELGDIKMVEYQIQFDLLRFL